MSSTSQRCLNSNEEIEVLGITAITVDKHEAFGGVRGLDAETAVDGDDLAAHGGKVAGGVVGGCPSTTGITVAALDVPLLAAGEK